jgi:ubiquinone/menaquinone biosynthesis C-methylase UbiE
MFEKDEYLRIFEKLLKKFHNSLILNVGCGRDVLFSDLQKKGAEVVELDIIKEPLKEIKAYDARHLVRADAHHLPFRDNIFDLVFAIGVLHHLKSIQKASEEVIRVVKCGKFILFSEPNKLYLSTRIIESLPFNLTYYLRSKIFPKLFHLYNPPASYERTLHPKYIKRLMEEKVTRCYEIFDKSPHTAIHGLQSSPFPLKLWENLVRILEKIKLWKRLGLFLSYKFIIICQK